MEKQKLQLNKVKNLKKLLNKCIIDGQVDKNCNDDIFGN